MFSKQMQKLCLFLMPDRELLSTSDPTVAFHLNELKKGLNLQQSPSQPPVEVEASPLIEGGTREESTAQQGPGDSEGGSKSVTQDAAPEIQVQRTSDMGQAGPTAPNPSLASDAANTSKSGATTLVAKEHRTIRISQD